MRIAPTPANDTMPSHSRFTPATNITTNAVVPSKAVVPRSTSLRTSPASKPMIASGRLKGNSSESYPTARTVDAHSNMREVAKRQSDKREGEPKPPCPLPEVIVGQRSKRADDKSNPEPKRLPFDEKINVAMAVARKRTRTKKHDDADGE